MAESSQAINHVAITFPDQATWQQQLEFLQREGIGFHRPINHGMTHGVNISDPSGYGVRILYESPRKVWEGDVDGTLNYAERLTYPRRESVGGRRLERPNFW